MGLQDQTCFLKTKRALGKILGYNTMAMYTNLVRHGSFQWQYNPMRDEQRIVHKANLGDLVL